MTEMCNDKKALFRKIHECEFMIIDLGLYLDTHPDCTQALTAFHKHQAEYEHNVAEYERLYGPLTFYQVNPVQMEKLYAALEEITGQVK